MLLKPSGGVPHVGGVLTAARRALLRDCSAAGSPAASSSTSTARASSRSSLPEARRSIAAARHEAAVRRLRRPTPTAASATCRPRRSWIRSNTEVATVDSQGSVTAVRRGEATVLARYEGSYAATTFIVMGDRSGFAWKPRRPYNWIDELVYAKLEQVKVLPSDVCDDGEFVRRRLPRPDRPAADVERTAAFLADQRAEPGQARRADRRAGRQRGVRRPLDEQVGRPAPGQPQVPRRAGGHARSATGSGRRWRTNTPYDKFVYERPDRLRLELRRTRRPATTRCCARPTRSWRTPRSCSWPCASTATSATTTRSSAGPRTSTTSWRRTSPRWAGPRTRATRARRSAAPTSRAPSRSSRSSPTSRPARSPTPAPGRSSQPARSPTRTRTWPTAEAPRREQVAKWITSKENQYFAKSYVNRLWAYLLGVGLIEPIDDIRAGNPATNPKLLDALTAEFVKSNFDTRHMIKLICKSRTYQHSVATNRWNARRPDQLHARHRPPAAGRGALRRHPPGHRLDEPPAGPAAGARAAQLLDSAWTPRAGSSTCSASRRARAPASASASAACSSARC